MAGISRGVLEKSGMKGASSSEQVKNILFPAVAFAIEEFGEGCGFKFRRASPVGKLVVAFEYPSLRIDNGSAGGEPGAMGYHLGGKRAMSDRFSNTRSLGYDH